MKPVCISWRRSLWRLALLGACVFAVHAAYADSTLQTSPTLHREALVLHSYSMDYPWTASLTEGILSVFQEDSQLEVRFEYLDAKRHESEEYKRRLLSLLEWKYRKAKPEIILACDDDALRFLLDHRDRLFPGVPIVFTSVGQDLTRILLSHRNLTGIQDRTDLRETLRLAILQNPGAKRLLVISDASYSGRLLLRDFNEAAEEYEGRIEIIRLSNATVEELRETLQNLPPRTPVIFLSFFHDRNGVSLSVHEALDHITVREDLPVYVIRDYALLPGVLGGKVLIGREEGRAAAILARRILNGEKADAIPVQTDRSGSWVFRHDSLQRLGIPESRIPEGSRISGRPISLFSLYRKWILGALGFILLQSLLALYLLVQRAIRRRAEQALRESESQLRQLFEGIDDAIFVHDEQGRILNCNAAACRRLGYSREELLSMSVRDLDTPEFASQFEERLRIQLETGHFSGEGAHRARDGRLVPVDINTSVIEYGGQRAILSVIRDISDRKEAEDRLRERERIYRETIEASAGVPYVVRYGGDQEDFRYEYFGEGVEKILDITARELTPARFRAMVRKTTRWDSTETFDPSTMRSAFLRGEIEHFRMDILLETPKGRFVWAQDCSTPIRDPQSGRVVGSIGILMDITERKQAAHATALQRDMEMRLNRAQNIQEGLEIILDTLVHIDGVDCAGMYLRDPETGDLRLIGQRGLPEKYHASAACIPAGSPQELLIRQREPIFGPFEEVIPPEAQGELCEILKAFASVPVQSENQLMAVINAGSFTLRDFHEYARKLLLSIASHAGSIMIRLRTLEQERRNQENLHNLMQSMTDIVLVIEPTGRILDFNAEAIQRLGYSEEELRSLNLLDLHREEDAVSAAQCLQHLQEKGSALCSLPFRKKDGALVPVETRFQRGAWSQREVFFAVARDISERLRAQEEREALWALSQRLSESQTLREAGKAVAETARHLFDYDAFMLTLFDNEEAYAKAIYAEDTHEGEETPHEITELWKTSLAEERAASVYRGKSLLINRPEPKPNPTPGLVPFGEEQRLSRSLMFVRITWSGQMVGVISAQSYTPGKYSERDLRLLEALAAQCGGALLRVNMEEIRQQLDSQIQQTAKLESLGLLAGGIAHDFNNLLAGILGNASFVYSELPGDSPLREAAQQIEASAQRAADLTRQLLAYSGKGRVIVQPLDLGQLIHEMRPLLGPALSKKTRVHLEIEPDTPPVEAEASQMRQVFMNLLMNASEALEDTGGDVYVKTGLRRLQREAIQRIILGVNLEPGDYVMLEVRDTGKGMPPEILSRIFEPFFSAKKTGRGLGLAAVTGIVRGHKGGLSVESVPGKGTTFRLYFPPCARAAAPLPPSSPQPEPPKLETRKTGIVLVIDDEAIVRNLASRILKREGYEILEAAGGREALAILAEKSATISAAVLDLTMPEMSGEETLRQIRASFPDLPVLLSSGYTQEDDPARFAALRPAGFLQKPYRPKDLSAALARALETARNSG